MFNRNLICGLPIQDGKLARLFVFGNCINAARITIARGTDKFLCLQNLERGLTPPRFEVGHSNGELLGDLCLASMDDVVNDAVCFETKICSHSDSFGSLLS